ncbi:MAG: hypothetical protein V4710_15420 [Verrucomicrobiota bacterium]
MRLLTVNTYIRLPCLATDLTLGPAAYDRWQNFYPLIADFLSDSRERISQRKSQIAESEWSRCLFLGQQYLEANPGLTRDGSPFASFTPATYA